VAKSVVEAKGQPGTGLRRFADWASRAVFVVAVVVGWIGLGPPWAPKSAGDIGVLDSGLVLVAAFVLAALIQRVIVADYAIKAGPIELSSLEHAAITTTDVAEKLTQELQTALGRVRADVRQLRAAGSESAGEIGALKERADAVGRQIEYLEASVQGLLTAVGRLHDEVTRGE
jgi:hypothetical protein